MGTCSGDLGVGWGKNFGGMGPTHNRDYEG